MKISMVVNPGFKKWVSYMPQFGQLSVRVWGWRRIVLAWEWR